MAPLLIVRYLRLAKEEEEEMEFVFGEAYRRYRQQVSALWPWRRKRSVPVADRVLQR